MAQVMHPEMRGSLEGFSVELLLMDSKLNRVLAPEFTLEADEFATVQLVKKAIKSAELLQSTCLARVKNLAPQENVHWLGQAPRRCRAGVFDPAGHQGQIRRLV